MRASLRSVLPVSNSSAPRVWRRRQFPHRGLQTKERAGRFIETANHGGDGVLYAVGAQEMGTSLHGTIFVGRVRIIAQVKQEQRGTQRVLLPLPQAKSINFCQHDITLHFRSSWVSRGIPTFLTKPTSLEDVHVNDSVRYTAPNEVKGCIGRSECSD